MARFFYFAFAIFALCLIVIFSLPHIVPRSLLRAELENALSSLTGREAHIAGSVRLSFLPMPYLAARQITLADDRTIAPSGDFLTLDEVEAGIAIIPLLSGRINFSVLRLVRPVLAVERYEDDFLDDLWRRKRTWNQFMRFSSVLVEDGIIKYLDLRHGREILLRKINGTLSADSLSGPFKGEVRLTHDEGEEQQRYEIDFSIGRLTKTRQLRARFDLRMHDRPVHLSLSGLFSKSMPSAEFPDFRGRMILDVDALSHFFDVPKNIKIFHARAHIASDVDMAGSKIKLSHFLLETRNLRFKGKGDIDFYDARPSINFLLNSPDIAAAHIFRGAPDRSWRDFINSAEDGADDITRYFAAQNIDFNISIGAEVFRQADSMFKDAAFALIVRAGRITRFDVDALLPGSSRLTLHAARVHAQRVHARHDRGEGAFIGRLGITTGHFSALSSWALDEEGWADVIQALRPQFGDHFALEADMILGGAGIRFEKIEASLGALSMTGAGSGAADMDLSFALDRLVVDDDSELPRAIAQAAQRNLFYSFAKLNIKARLAIKQMMWRGAALNNFIVAARLKDRQWLIDQIALAASPRDKIEGAGVLDWTKGRPDMRFNLEVSARHAQWLLTLMDIKMPPKRARYFDDISLKVDFSAEKKSIRRLEVKGDIGGSALRLKGKDITRSGQTRFMDVKADLSHPNSVILVRQLDSLPLAIFNQKVPPSLIDAGAGLAQMRIKGRIDGRFRALARFKLGDMRYGISMAGEKLIDRLEIKIKAAGTDPMRLVEALALDDIVGAAPRNVDKRFILYAHLSYNTKTGARVRSFDLATQKSRLVGEGFLARENGLWMIEADLKSHNMPFPLLEPDLKQGGLSRSLPLGLLEKARGSIKLAARNMRLGGFALNKAYLDIGLSSKGLKAESFDVGFAGGRISGAGALLRDSSGVNLDFRFLARNMDLSQLTSLALGHRVVSGMFDISGAMTARGAVPSLWVKSLSGTGKIKTGAGSFHGFDIGLLNKAVPQLDAFSHLGVTLGYVFNNGQTSFEKTSEVFSVKDGVITARGAPLMAPGVRGVADLLVDLARQRLKAEFRFTLPSRETYPPLRYIISGSWNNPQKRFDAAGFEQAFGRELIMDGIRKIEMDEDSAKDLPLELLDLLEYTHTRQSQRIN